jgi:phospholipase/lecithinase/hemolysin
MRFLPVAALGIQLLLTTASHGAQFSGLYIFGDSLSDPGNNALALGSKVSPPTNVTLQSEITSDGFIPTFPYVNSLQYSNGDVWAYQFARMLGLPSQVAGPVLGGAGMNYAFGGATTGPLNNSDGPPSLLTQVSTFTGSIGSGQAPSDALYIVAGGGNDARAALAAIAGGGDPNTVIATMAAQYAANVGSIVDTLQGKGAQNIVVWNVPNIGLTPGIAYLGPTASYLGTTVAQSMNDALSLRLSSETGIRTFDTFGLITSINANPGAYGLTYASTAGGSVPGADLAKYLCWDGIHPTTAGHTIIAQSLYGAVVPEPSNIGLLVAGMVLMSIPMVLRRRS